MSIYIYNTLTKKKEELKPIKKKSIGMYVCGVTVYDECHIGHARSLFIFEVIRRYLKYRKFDVKFVRNITDVDDKIIQRAAKEVGSMNEKVREVAEKYTKSYYRDMKALGIKKADIEPKATENIEGMIKLIKKLIKKGFAYEKDGDVYFEVRKFKDYGKLSKQGLDEMKSGSRVELDEKKSDPLDFALWKSSKENEPYWDSPWGHGRPGWHIECSVMSMKYLGENFDIHGGGRDLVFPHHENEIAQSEACTGKQFAKYWMHHGLLTINGQKMSKSLGNFITIKDVLSKYSSDVLKLFFLQAHYSQPVDFTWEKMEEAKKASERFYILFDKLHRLSVIGYRLSVKKSFKKEIDDFRKRFEEVMDDDFNTAQALAVLFDMVTYVNKQMGDGAYAKNILLELGGVLGLFENREEKTLPLSKKDIESKIKIREECRNKKMFKKADDIRKSLDEAGVILEDQKDGTTWRMK